MRRKLTPEEKKINDALKFLSRHRPEAIERFNIEIIQMDFKQILTDLVNSKESDSEKYKWLLKWQDALDRLLTPSNFKKQPLAYLAYLEKKDHLITSINTVFKLKKHYGKKLFSAKQEGNKDNNQLVYEEVLSAMATKSLTKSQAVESVAKMLGKAKSTIWRKIKQYGVE